MRSLVLCYCRGYPRFLKRDDPGALHYIKDDRLILHCVVGVVKAKVEGPRHYRVTISPSDVGQGLKALLKFGLGTDINFLVSPQSDFLLLDLFGIQSPVFWSS